MLIQAEMYNAATQDGFGLWMRLGLVAVVVSWYLLVRYALTSDTFMGKDGNNPKKIEFWVCSFFALPFSVFTMGMVLGMLVLLRWVVTGK